MQCAAGLGRIKIQAAAKLAQHIQDMLLGQASKEQRQCDGKRQENMMMVSLAFNTKTLIKPQSHKLQICLVAQFLTEGVAGCKYWPAGTQANYKPPQEDQHNTTDSPPSVDFPIQSKRNRTKDSIIEANTQDCHARPNAHQVKSRHAAGPSALRLHGPLEDWYNITES